VGPRADGGGDLQSRYEAKKLYDFTRKMEQLRSELIEYRRKYQSRKPHWRSPTKITSRYHKLCEDLYLSPKYYRLTFANGTMSFRKDPQEISAHQAMTGKNIIVTDNHTWSTERRSSVPLSTAPASRTSSEQARRPAMCG
jgi:hypothetical protein